MVSVLVGMHNRGVAITGYNKSAGYANMGWLSKKSTLL